MYDEGKADELAATGVAQQVADPGIRGLFLARAEECEAVAGMWRPGVLMVQLRGVVTLAALKDLRAKIGGLFAIQARAYIVDYRLATLIMSPQQLDESVLDDFQLVPGAVLAAPDDRRRFCGSARRTVAAGVIRRVFVEPAEAMAWAVKLAALEA